MLESGGAGRGKKGEEEDESTAEKKVERGSAAVKPPFSPSPLLPFPKPVAAFLFLSSRLTKALKFLSSPPPFLSALSTATFLSPFSLPLSLSSSCFFFPSPMAVDAVRSPPPSFSKESFFLSSSSSSSVLLGAIRHSSPVPGECLAFGGGRGGGGGGKLGRPT